MIFSLNSAADQLHPLIESQQITQHPQIQVDADCYVIDNKWFIFSKLHLYIQLFELKQWEIVCYMLINILHFWYWEFKFAMFFFHEAIFHDLYSTILTHIWLKKWNENTPAILHCCRNNITAVQIIFLI